MIQVILLILKIIGSTILAILGLILLVLALVLFVPVFYRVRIIHNPEKTQVKGRASYLFPLVLVTLEYFKKFSYKVRIFGFAVLDSDKPKKEKKEKPKKEKKPKKKTKQKTTEEKTTELVPTESESVPSSATEQSDSIPEEKKPSFSEQKEEQPEKQSLFEKIKCKIQKIRETISNVIKKVNKLLHQKDEVQRILAQPETKKAFAFAWEELKHLLKHILPRKIKGYVIFGADNPATTGQVLGVISVVYAKTGQLLDIRPNFEEKQLECDVELKGRIQLFTLVVIGVKVLLNKELRQLIKEIKGLKEIE